MVFWLLGFLYSIYIHNRLRNTTKDSKVGVEMVPNHDRIQRPKGENIDENQKF